MVWKDFRCGSSATGSERFWNRRSGGEPAEGARTPTPAAPPSNGRCRAEARLDSAGIHSGATVFQRGPLTLSHDGQIFSRTPGVSTPERTASRFSRFLSTRDPLVSEPPARTPPRRCFCAADCAWPSALAGMQRNQHAPQACGDGDRSRSPSTGTFSIAHPAQPTSRVRRAACTHRYHRARCTDNRWGSWCIDEHADGARCANLHLAPATAAAGSRDACLARKRLWSVELCRATLLSPALSWAVLFNVAYNLSRPKLRTVGRFWCHFDALEP